ncbi:MAG: hypothetical protein WCT31_01275 [Candidatus Micrarchaeia archaeon]
MRSKLFDGTRFRVVKVAGFAAVAVLVTGIFIAGCGKKELPEQAQAPRNNVETAIKIGNTTISGTNLSVIPVSTSKAVVGECWGEKVATRQLEYGNGEPEDGEVRLPQKDQHGNTTIKGKIFPGKCIYRKLYDDPIYGGKFGDMVAVKSSDASGVTLEITKNGNKNEVQVSEARVRWNESFDLSPHLGIGTFLKFTGLNSNGTVNFETYTPEVRGNFRYE